MSNFVNLKPSNYLINKIQSYAPNCTYSGSGYERRFGEWSDDAEIEHTGFANFCIHVQAGLCDCTGLYVETLKLIHAVQNDYSNKYLIFVFSFGEPIGKPRQELIFPRGTVNDSLAIRKTAASIEEMIKECNYAEDSFITKLTPKGADTNLYGKAVGFEKNDLLIIIGKSGTLKFDAKFTNKFTSSTTKRALFIEINGDEIIWNYHVKFLPEFV